ncbi:MAG: polysaccharide biosynthesis protein [Desulfobaccales bacterium]
MCEFFRNKVILVTGAAGSVGQELVRQLLSAKPAEVRALDNNETELFFLGERYRATHNLTVHLGDVRHLPTLEDICHGVNVIFHAAAFKHVGVAECNPADAVQTNVIGVENIIRAAIRQGVERVLFTSSDKAVNPTTVMGTTKLIGERLITAANLVNRGLLRRFASVRFGNVIGSRGSVVAIFAEQIRRGGPVTITDPEMTRFFMTMDEAVKLLLKACAMACGGEVFVTKMPVMRIRDLAQAMIAVLAPMYGFEAKNIPIRFTGPRAGEKLAEELLTPEEMGRALETDDMFVVLPSLQGLTPKIQYLYKGRVERASLQRHYHSAHQAPMTVEEISHFLLAHRILGDLVPARSCDASEWQIHRHLRLVADPVGGVAAYR